MNIAHVFFNYLTLSSPISEINLALFTTFDAKGDQQKPMLSFSSFFLDGILTQVDKRQVKLEQHMTHFCFLINGFNFRIILWCYLSVMRGMPLVNLNLPLAIIHLKTANFQNLALISLLEDILSCGWSYLTFCNMKRES